MSWIRWPGRTKLFSDYFEITDLGRLNYTDCHKLFIGMKTKHRNRLFLKVFALFGFFVMMIVLFIGYMVIPLQKKSLQEIMYAQAVSVSRSIIQASSDAMINRDFGFIVEHNLQVLKNNHSIRYILISPIRGKRIFIKPASWEVYETPNQFLDDLQKDQDQLLFLEDQLIADRVYHFVYPINFSGIEWGWIHIGFSTEKYDYYVKEINGQIAYIIAVSLSLILFLGFFFARWITRPLLNLSDMATQVASGNLEVSATLSRNDEIGDLFLNFNQMVSALKHSRLQQENYKQHLELEVRRRTKELDELNKNLDQRVKLEVLRRREQEQMLVHQSRLAAIGEMVGAIAHQWRQPLNALGLVLQNMQLTHQQGRLDEAAIRRSIDKSGRLINKMSSTIDDFRDFFKPKKNLEFFSPYLSIESVMELLAATLKNRGIKVEIIGDKQTEVYGYKGEFSQVILNIISNAIDSLLENQPDNPLILIVIKESQGKVLIDISDNGGGVKEQNLHKIFDPYFTTKSSSEGLGIGLYMSKMIIEKSMHGKLYAKNYDKGVTFTIELSISPDLQKNK